MATSIGGKCLKVFLTVFNIIFFLFGVAIAAVSGYAAFDKDSQIHEMIQAQNMPVLMIGLYILLAVGIILALIAFIGIWGALSENRCLLFVYFVFILLIFGLQLAGIIITFIEFRKVEAYLEKDVKSKPTSTNDTAVVFLQAAVKAGLEAAEKKFHCCGITGPSNYPPNQIPDTCYAPLPTSTRRKRAADPASAVEATTTTPPLPPTTTTTTTSIVSTTPKHGPLYTAGCITVAQPYLYAAGGIAIAILALEALVLLFTCCLMSEIKDDYTPV